MNINIANIRLLGVLGERDNHYTTETSTIHTLCHSILCT